MLGQMFLKVVDMSLSAGMIIVVVLLVRVLLKRFPKYISYLLWSVVLFRLLCPVTLESGISPVPSLEPVFYENISEKDAASTVGADEPAAVHTGGTEEKDTLGTGSVMSAQTVPQTVSVQARPQGNARAAKVSWQELFLLYGKYVWLSGLGIMLLYCVISTVRIRRRVSVSIPLKENIYIADAGISPFVMGLFRPRIYLPEGLGGKEQEYIILHEKFHIRRLDHVVKPVAFAALCIHWFNPLVWIAFLLFCKDMEMSCDEAVIKRMGENIRADYSASLLALSTRQRIPGGLPVDFGEGDTKDRVRNLAAFRKTKKGVLAALTVGVAVLAVCLASDHKAALADAHDQEGENIPLSGVDDQAGENTSLSGTDAPDEGKLPGLDTDGSEGEMTADKEPEAPEPLSLSLDITEYYQTHVGSIDNLYYIDENNVLWGSGENQCGQLGLGTRDLLGLGTQDFEFYEEPIKIAEDVIDVDYSQRGFVIFLTADHRLYGMGNAGCGALQQYSEFDYARFIDDERYYVGEPCLLMEDVMYARCGRCDVACMTEDGAVWIWGTINHEGNFLSHEACYIEKPRKVLENAVLVTGGWFNHAALLQDGTVWTWGYNGAGNCGVADLKVVSEPTKVAEDVVMVWTDRRLKGWPEPDKEEIAMAWRGELGYNMEYENIADLGDVGSTSLQNTVIRKADGSYWVCGENVGQEEKLVDGVEIDYYAVWSHEFYPCE